MDRLIFFGCMTLLVISGCSDTFGAKTKKSGSSINPDLMAVAVEDAGNLPVCDAKSKSRLIHILSTGEFRVCDGSAWMLISIKGEKGDQGEQGEKGDQGDQGARGDIGPSGIDVEKTLKFPEDATSPSVTYQNICPDCLTMKVRITYVLMNIFTDGSGFLSVGGYAEKMDTSTGGADSHRHETGENFSHAFFLDSTTDDQVFIAKFTHFSDSYMIRYTAKIGDTSSVKAVVKINANWPSDIEILSEAKKD